MAMSGDMVDGQEYQHQHWKSYCKSLRMCNTVLIQDAQWKISNNKFFFNRFSHLWD